MTGVFRTIAAVILFSVGLAASAMAHTPDISTGKIAPKDNRVVIVDVGFLATDLERMFQETMHERIGVDLSPPGALEAEIGKFVEKRIAMRDGTGRACVESFGKVGEDPEHQDSALIVLRFDCGATEGPLFYDATKLLAAQGAKGKHLVTLEGENAGQTMLYPDDPPLDLSKPMETTAQLMWKFLKAGVEHIVTGYDHLCFLFALILWAVHLAGRQDRHRLHHFPLDHAVACGAWHLYAALDTGRVADAASIIFVAVENFFSRDVDNRWRNTFFFGFIHGFGFASALTEMGVPQGGVVTALAAFNIGVELGQIAIVFAVMPILFFIDKQTGGKRNEKLVYALSALIAVAGLYWLLERIGVLPG
ncbi:MAG: HupE/UreJ family protein [Methylocystis sp.]